jgi:hypothetical protein
MRQQIRPLLQILLIQIQRVVHLAIAVAVAVAAVAVSQMASKVKRVQAVTKILQMIRKRQRQMLMEQPIADVVVVAQLAME